MNEALTVQTFAVAEEIVIVNQIPISTDSSGNLFVGANGEAGYKTDTRLSVSGSERTQSGHETTGFIPAKYADTIVKISDGKVVSVSKNDMNGDSKNEKD